jgi:hypothetical protein
MGKENDESEGEMIKQREASSGTSALDDGLGGWCPRGELVVAIHELASHFENALYAFRDDSEALLKAKRDIAWARNVAARHNRNGTGCRYTRRG